MSAVLSSIDIKSLTPRARPISEEVVVGKDILELLAGAMYADPLTIFREYVQNAADSIDVAREQGLPSIGGPSIVISIDRSIRTVRIRDTGASIPSRDFVRRLTTIGASGKRGTKQRGFRGVGRLSGLGYCQEITFRGRVAGEGKVTELHWNGRKLRELLRDATYQGDLGDLVRSIVETRHVPALDYPERFFEVELGKVSRLRNDVLLNPVRIREYLSQVAPVPFHPDFAFGERISNFLRRNGVREPIIITIEGEEEPVYHRARDSIELSATVTDRVSDVEFLELRGMDGEVAAFGWMLEHSYAGAVPRRLGLGGLRLRAGDVQVGSEATLAPLFVEPRFAGWAIGDIHVASDKILPNGRRDEFEPTLAYAYLQDELIILLKRVTQTIRDRSDQRTRLKRVQTQIAVIEAWLLQAEEGSLSPVVARHVDRILDARFEEAHKEVAKIPEGSPDQSASLIKIKALAKRRTAALPKGDQEIKSRKRSPREKTIDVALEVILNNVATPHAGLMMSRKLLSAFEAS